MPERGRGEQRTVRDAHDGEVEVAVGLADGEQEILVGPLGEELLRGAQLAAVLFTQVLDLVRLLGCATAELTSAVVAGTRGPQSSRHALSSSKSRALAAAPVGATGRGLDTAPPRPRPRLNSDITLKRGKRREV